MCKPVPTAAATATPCLCGSSPRPFADPAESKAGDVFPAKETFATVGVKHWE
jgi:hypothetical protein